MESGLYHFRKSDVTKYKRLTCQNTTVDVKMTLTVVLTWGLPAGPSPNRPFPKIDPLR